MGSATDWLPPDGNDEGLSESKFARAQVVGTTNPAANVLDGCALDAVVLGDAPKGVPALTEIVSVPMPSKVSASLDSDASAVTTEMTTHAMRTSVAHRAKSGPARARVDPLASPSAVGMTTASRLPSIRVNLGRVEGRDLRARLPSVEQGVLRLMVDSPLEVVAIVVSETPDNNSICLSWNTCTILGTYACSVKICLEHLFAFAEDGLYNGT